MLQKITVFFDGHTLQPEIPLDLEPNQHYVITVEAQTTDSQSEDGSGPVEVEACLKVRGCQLPVSTELDLSAFEFDGSYTSLSVDHDAFMVEQSQVES